MLETPMGYDKPSMKEAQLKVLRETFTKKSTIGKLFLGEDFFCYTLEDPLRDKKVYGETAIPEGTYQVIINYSPRFKKYLPLLLEVPGFEGIRIHTGNTPQDTLGCILVAQEKGNDIIYSSRPAFFSLMDRISELLEKSPVWIEIKKAA